MHVHATIGVGRISLVDVGESPADVLCCVADTMYLLVVGSLLFYKGRQPPRSSPGPSRCMSKFHLFPFVAFVLHCRGIELY